MNELKSFYLTKLIFNLEALQDMALPEFKGSAIHGAFGWEFKSSAGPLEEIYDYVFRSPSPADLPSDLKGVQNVPHPIIIIPPLFHRRWVKKGEVFSIGLTLIGSTSDFTPFLIEAVRKMGNKGLTEKRKKFRLINIYNTNIYNVNKLVYEDHNRILKTDYEKITAEQIVNKNNSVVKKIKLNFITPFVLQEKGKALVGKKGIEKLSAEILVANLERRFRHLAWLYCGVKPEKQTFDTTCINIAENKLHEFSLVRFNEDVFYGLIGSIVLEGELSTVLPLIHIGEHIHLGKKTSFGFGKYKIEFPE